MTARTCTECGGRLSRRNTTGQCKRCRPAIMARDPEIHRRQIEGIRRKLADPEYRAEHIARCIRNGRSLTPEQRDRKREHGRRRAPLLIEAARHITPEQRAENGRKRTETVLAWCPPEWRDRYRDLKKRGRTAAQAKAVVLDLIAGKPEPEKYAQQKAQLAWCPAEWRGRYHSLRSRHGAAEAKRRVLIEIDAAERKRLDAMTPFERQLERVRRGARLIEKPRLSRAPDVTLGGVSAGLL